LCILSLIQSGYKMLLAASASTQSHLRHPEGKKLTVQVTGEVTVAAAD